MSMSSVCCRPVSSDMVIAGTEFGSSLGIHLFWSPGAHSSWNRARWQNHRGQSLAGIGLFSGSPCERPKDTTHLQKLFWSWVLSPFVDEYLLMSPVVGRIVRSAYSLGRSVVECILLGGFWWVGFLSLQGLANAIFVRTICLTLLVHVFHATGSWWNKICMHLVTWIWLSLPWNSGCCEISVPDSSGVKVKII
jgi:hypothetical protein